ncbi:MAG: hypothetical protein Q9170_001847 [Blastenia crenularia]
MVSSKPQTEILLPLADEKDNDLRERSYWTSAQQPQQAVIPNLHGEEIMDGERIRPLQLLDLPTDILKEIIKELTYTNDLTSLARTCTALSRHAIPLIYSRFDIVWPDIHSSPDSHSSVDALTHGLATLVMGNEPNSTLQPFDNPQDFACSHCGTINVVASGSQEPKRAVGGHYRRRNHYPQYTRKFSLGNGPDEWIKEYLINKESGKMLGTLVALALARMPNLETFVWDMPTGILRDCWLALGSLTEGKNDGSSKLEKVWVRFHNNRETIEIPPNKRRKRTRSALAWSFEHVESPNFSILPPLRSLNVLSIDEIAYLQELSLLIQHSLKGLRELRIGLASTVPQDGFSSTRDLPPVDDEARTEYQDALARLMSRIAEEDTKRLWEDWDLSSRSNSPTKSTTQQKDNSESKGSAAIPASPASMISKKSNDAQLLPGGLPESLLEAMQVPDPAGLLDGLIPTPKPAASAHIGESAAHQPSLIALNETTATPAKMLKLDAAKKSEGIAETPRRMDQKLEEYSEHTRRLNLEVLELERLDLDITVLLKTIDWSLLTTLTLLHCDSHESLWRAFRRMFSPRQTMSQPVLRQKSKMHLLKFSSIDPPMMSRSDYQMNLRNIHTNTVSSALIAFLKETLAPNSLKWLFLQDGGIVSNPSGERRPYDSNVSVEAILRGPLRRHRLSIQKLVIDSGFGAPDSRGRGQGWQKWALTRDVLSYVTSGKMSALRELAFSLDFKDWHVFLQKVPSIPHVRSIYIPHIADYPYGHHVNAKELALQVLDIVAIVPNMELCYLGISTKCFEILEGVHDDDAGTSLHESSATPANPGPDDASDSDEESDNDDDDDDEEDEDDNGHDGQTANGNLGHPLAGGNNGIESEDEGDVDSDHGSEGSEGSEVGNTQARPEVFPLAKIIAYAIISLPLLRAAPLRNGPITTWEEAPMAPDKPTLWIYLAVAIALVLLGGAFAGLTIALMGQDEIYLQVIKTSGEGSERKHATRVLTLLKRGKHWVLVTLLLGNVITNETLPIVLDRSLGGGWPAVLGSTVLIVIFGEIIPQSICVRYGLPIGAYLSPLVLVLMYILSPVAWPTAKLLDRLLGEDHGTTYKKAGLKTLVTLHKSLGAAGEQLNSDEVTIISAVLDLKAKPIGSIMTPIKDVFTMSSDTVLDEKTMDVILGAGYSRIPIHEPKNPQNYVGMLLVKILITYDPEDGKKVNEFALATLPETAPETSCLDIVNFFQEGKSHMVLVSERPGQDSGAIGVVTLEDVIEELIGEEIIDESDVYIDVHKAIRRTNVAPRTRIGKHGVVPEPESNIGKAEEDLIDVGDDSKPQHKALQRTQTHDQITSANGSTPDSAPSSRRNSNLRRTSSIASVNKDGHLKPVSKGDHIRNLGPSNLASRPRQTRYNTVKIKPGGGSLAENLVKVNETAHSGSPLAMSTATPAPHGGVGTGLLNSAGKDASDGVLAVQQGYGTITDSTPPKSAGKTSSGGPSAASQAHPAATIPEEQQQEPQRSKSKSNSTSHHSDSESTIGSLRKTNRHSRFASSHHPPDISPRQKGGTARSGSITENIIDMGGIKKVVLETTSSSEEANNTTTSNDNAADSQGGTGNGKGNEEGTDGGVPLNAQEGASEGKEGQKTGSGRKKRRRKTRKGGPKGKGDREEGSEPLLKENEK